MNCELKNLIGKIRDLGLKLLGITDHYHVNLFGRILKTLPYACFIYVVKPFSFNRF